jgi:AcrR family transcriptional regulator
MTTSVAGHLPPGLDLSDARLRVFEAAVGLFGEVGFHGASMRDLAQALGVTGASLYAHVPSKQHLLFEVIRIGLTEYIKRLQESLLEAGLDPSDQMRAVVRAHVLSALEYPALTRTCSQEMRHLEGALLDQVLTIQAQSRQLFLGVVDRGTRLGEFRVADPIRAMRAIADMGVRTAEWPRPSGTDDEIATDYAQYAVRLLSDS